MPFLKGETQEGPRHEFLCWTDDGDLAALRYNKWKVMFLEQRAQGFDTWQEPFVQLRLPKLFDLHADPYERAEYEAIDYAHWGLTVTPDEINRKVHELRRFSAKSETGGPYGLRVATSRTAGLHYTHARVTQTGNGCDQICQATG
jgi:hypothetical protein